MKKKRLGQGIEDFLKIWAEMHDKQVQMLNEESEDNSTDKAIVWSSQLTSPGLIENYLNRDKYIIQTWTDHNDKLNDRLLGLGYKLIISTGDAWYLDHGFWGGIPYRDWRAIYKNRIPNKVTIIQTYFRH